MSGAARPCARGDPRQHRRAPGRGRARSGSSVGRNRFSRHRCAARERDIRPLHTYTVAGDVPSMSEIEPARRVAHALRNDTSRTDDWLVRHRTGAAVNRPASRRAERGCHQFVLRLAGGRGDAHEGRAVGRRRRRDVRRLSEFPSRFRRAARGEVALARAPGHGMAASAVSDWRARKMQHFAATPEPHPRTAAVRGNFMPEEWPRLLGPAFEEIGRDAHEALVAAEARTFRQAPDGDAAGDGRTNRDRRLSARAAAARYRCRVDGARARGARAVCRSPTGRKRLACARPASRSARWEAIAAGEPSPAAATESGSSETRFHAAVRHMDARRPPRDGAARARVRGGARLGERARGGRGVERLGARTCPLVARVGVWPCSDSSCRRRREHVARPHCR